jgi:predicted DNA-binding WGR domain protein
MARAMVTRRRAETEVPKAHEESEAEERSEETTTRSARKGTRSSRVAEKAKVNAGAGAGWGAYGKAKAQTKAKSFNSDDQLKVEDEPILVKFLEPHPFDTYFQHWVQRGKGKKRSWTCPDEESCPLCAMEHPVRNLALFNVVLIDGATHTLKYWQAGKNAGDQIEEFANSKRYSPIDDDDLYFEVIRKEADFGYKYTLNPLRASELEDEEVVSDEEYDDFIKRLFVSNSSTIDPVDYEGLEECADELVRKGDR